MVILACATKLAVALPLAVTEIPLVLVSLQVNVLDLSKLAVGETLPLVLVTVPTAAVIGKYLVLLAAVKVVPASNQPAVLILELPDPVKAK